MDAATHRSAVADLAQHLVVEFAGTLAPGQVLRIVHQADRLVLRSAGASQKPVVLCEAIARRVLHERVVDELRRRNATSA